MCGLGMRLLMVCGLGMRLPMDVWFGNEATDCVGLGMRLLIVWVWK